MVVTTRVSAALYGWTKAEGAYEASSTWERGVGSRHFDGNFFHEKGILISSAALKPEEMGRIVGSMGTRP